MGYLLSSMWCRTIWYLTRWCRQHNFSPHLPAKAVQSPVAEENSCLHNTILSPSFYFLLSKEIKKPGSPQRARRTQRIIKKYMVNFSAIKLGYLWQLLFRYRINAG